jgi:hypothetical protein
LREACCRAAAAALALALAITTELGPPPALAAGQAGVTPYDEGKAILLGPNAEGRVRPCGINPNCVSSSNLDDLYGPPWRSPVRPRGPGGPPPGPRRRPPAAGSCAGAVGGCRGGRAARAAGWAGIRAQTLLFAGPRPPQDAKPVAAAAVLEVAVAAAVPASELARASTLADGAEYRAWSVPR